MADPTMPTNPGPPSEIAGAGLIAVITRATAAVHSLGAELKATTQTAEETAAAAKKAKAAVEDLETSSSLTLDGPASTNNAGSSYEPPGAGNTLSEITAGLLQQAGRR